MPAAALRARCALARGQGLPSAPTWPPAWEQQPLTAVPEVAIWGGGSRVLLLHILRPMDLKRV